MYSKLNASRIMLKLISFVYVAKIIYVTKIKKKKKIRILTIKIYPNYW